MVECGFLDNAGLGVDGVRLPKGALMTERTKKFTEELNRLIDEGDLLHMAIQFECHEKDFRQALETKNKSDKKKVREYISALPSFKDTYQSWFSRAQAVVKQVLPDRLADFNSYYEYPKVRKEVDFANYMIRDYLQGLRVTTAGGTRVVADGSAAIPEFVQQLNLLKAAKTSLESTLMDLTAVLQADLFDSEIDSARSLAKGGYLRGTGAICGVIIEKHLLHVCDMHGLKTRKQNPGISDLNQLLRDADITTIPQWRFIQSLADIRNICDHAKGREPTKDEIQDLLSGTDKVLKTVF